MLYGYTPFRGKTRQRTFANILHKDLKFPKRRPVRSYSPMHFIVFISCLQPFNIRSRVNAKTFPKMRPQDKEEKPSEAYKLLMSSYSVISDNARIDWLLNCF